MIKELKFVEQKKWFDKKVKEAIASDELEDVVCDKAVKKMYKELKSLHNEYLNVFRRRLK